MTPKEPKTKEQIEIEILTWVKRLCGSGMTTGMIRLAIHNKIVELGGTGEKA